MSLSFKPSTRKHKKYDAFLDGKKIASFGDKRYEHFHDKIGHYSNLNHNDESRRKSYRARHHKTSQKKYSPSYFAYHYLW